MKPEQRRDVIDFEEPTAGVDERTDPTDEQRIDTGKVKPAFSAQAFMQEFEAGRVAEEQREQMAELALFLRRPITASECDSPGRHIWPLRKEMARA